jgi:hypothetical protein
MVGLEEVADRQVCMGWMWNVDGTETAEDE